MKLNLEQRYLGSLLGLAVGDTLGASVEFLQRDSFVVNDMPTEEVRGVKPGYFTDDTSMALCLADSLIYCQGFKPIDQMYRYLRWFQEGFLSPYGMPFGLGNTVHDSIKRFVETQEPFAGSDHPMTAGIGSLMRLAPIPMFYRKDPELAAHYAGESSRTTHQALEAIEACQVYARMIAAALEGQDKEEILSATGAVDSLSDNIRRIALGSYQSLKREEVQSTGYVVHSLEAALWCFYHSSDFREGALLAVNLGDDTDTVAAIYGQLAGAHYGVEAIPRDWRDMIVMRDIIEGMAEQLYELSELMPKLVTAK